MQVYICSLSVNREKRMNFVLSILRLLLTCSFLYLIYIKVFTWVKSTQPFLGPQYQGVLYCYISPPTTQTHLPLVCKHKCTDTHEIFSVKIFGVGPRIPAWVFVVTTPPGWPLPKISFAHTGTWGLSSIDNSCIRCLRIKLHARHLNN